MPTLKIIDKYQIEIDSHLDANKDKIDLSLFMYLPPQLGVDSFTYPQELFYRNLVTEQCFIYGVPDLDLLLKQIDGLKQYCIDSNGTTHKIYWSQLSLISMQWQRGLKHVIKNLVSECTTANITNLLLKLEQLRQKLHQNRPGSHLSKALKSFNYLDDYMHLYITQQLLSLIVKAKEQKNKSVDEWQHKVFVFIDTLNQYRVEQQFREYQATEHGAQKQQAKITQLERYLHAPIRLLSTRKKEGLVVEQLVFGLAAAASMAIATAIAFYTQKLFGNFSNAFFYALVLSYILKDRFKEISRTIVFSYFRRHSFNYSYAISDRSSQKKVMLIKDAYSFLKADKIMPSVKALRDKNRINNNAKDERQVLKYRRQIAINPSLLPPGQEKVSDRITINISKLLRNLSELKSTLYFYENGKTKAITTRQRFSIDLYLLYKTNTVERTINHRLFFNKKGIFEIK